jgi:UDP-N-acetylmuramate--alanine ligase
VTGVYSAGEKPIPGVSAETIVKNIPEGKAVYIEKKEQVADYLETELKEGDVFFTIGAGDIYAVGKEVLNRLRSRRNHKVKEHAEVVRIA